MIDHRDEPYGEWSAWDTFLLTSAGVALAVLLVVAVGLGWVA